MRYGVLADIHGNLPALDAVLEALAHESVEAFICAGDLVGYGPFPNECVERVARLGAVCVAGNHDLIVLGRLSDDRCIPIAKETLSWTEGVLTDASRRYLAGLPRRAELGDGILVAHGSLDDPEEYTRDAERAAAQRRRLGEAWPGTRILVLGHTHRAAVWGERTAVADPPDASAVALDDRDTYVVNPGAVGQSRERVARARFMVLDFDRRVAVFRAVRYDVACCRRALRSRGLPTRSPHLRPGRFGAVPRPLRRLVRRSLRRLA